MFEQLFELLAYVLLLLSNLVTLIIACVKRKKGVTLTEEEKAVLKETVTKSKELIKSCKKKLKGG